MSDVLKEFGGVLRDRRMARGWTQLRLAKEAGIPRRYLGDIEAGRKNCTLLTVSKLAQAFGLSNADLLKPVKPPQGPTADPGQRLLTRIKRIVRNGSKRELHRIHIFLDELL